MKFAIHALHLNPRNNFFLAWGIGRVDRLHTVFDYNLQGNFCIHISPQCSEFVRAKLGLLTGIKVGFVCIMKDVCIPKDLL